MTLRMMGMGMVLGAMALVGCAGANQANRAGSTATAAIAGGETRWETCFPWRAYDQEDTAAMQQMSDEGASNAQIASKLGGTAQQVRCWQARVRGQADRNAAQLARARAGQ